MYTPAPARRCSGAAESAIVVSRSWDGTSGMLLEGDCARAESISTKKPHMASIGNRFMNVPPPAPNLAGVLQHVLHMPCVFAPEFAPRLSRNEEADHAETRL